MSYESKSSAIQGRQLKVQEAAIPFTITFHATPASVLTANDEPSVLFLRTEGNDKITAASGALASGETATYANASVDITGVSSFLVKLGEVCTKVVSAYVVSRTTGVTQPCFLGSATGISSAGNIMLTCDSTVNYATTSFDGTLVVRYII